MKKIILTSMMMLLVSAFSFGKTDVSFGPKIGVNISSMTNSGDAKAGLLIGGFSNIRFNDYIALQPELIFSMQGHKTGLYNEWGDKIGNIKFMVNYINVPVMVKGYLWKGLNIEAGPQLGFRVNAKYKADSSYKELNQKTTDAFKVLDFGIGVGLGYETKIGLTAGFRYTISVTNAYKRFFENKNRVFQFALGWKF